MGVGTARHGDVSTSVRGERTELGLRKKALLLSGGDGDGQRRVTGSVWGEQVERLSADGPFLAVQ